MSNCHSAQAEYSDHDFKGGICNDCGEVSKPDVKALNAQIAMLEAKVTELTERNRKLANQIVGYGDRMQATIAGIVKEAKVEALREAARSLLDDPSAAPATVKWNYNRIYAGWVLERADNLEAS